MTLWQVPVLLIMVIMIIIVGEGGEGVNRRAALSRFTQKHVPNVAHSQASVNRTIARERGIGEGERWSGHG